MSKITRRKSITQRILGNSVYHDYDGGDLHYGKVGIDDSNMFISLDGSRLVTFGGTSNTIYKPTSFSKRTSSGYVTLTASDSVSIDASLGNVFYIELDRASTALANPTNLVAGSTYIFIVVQDGDGSRSLTFGSSYKAAGGSVTLSTGANDVDIISGVTDGTNLYINVVNDFDTIS